MEIDDLRAKTDDELQEELEESSREAMNLRFRVATMQLADVSSMSRVRKRVARIKTILRERDLARGKR
jgi:large subunit ribosomal protein L29